jgi:hypothetical protein
VDGILGGIWYLIDYHSRKVNVVAYALCQKVKMARLTVQEVQIVQEVLTQEAEIQKGKIYISNLKLVLYLKQKIFEAQ